MGFALKGGCDVPEQYIRKEIMMDLPRLGEIGTQDILTDLLYDKWFVHQASSHVKVDELEGIKLIEDPTEGRVADAELFAHLWRSKERIPEEWKGYAVCFLGTTMGKWDKSHLVDGHFVLMWDEKKKEWVYEIVHHLPIPKFLRFPAIMS